MGCSTSKQQKQIKNSKDVLPNGSSKNYDNQVVTNLKDVKSNEAQQITTEKISQSSHDEEKHENCTFESSTVNDSDIKETKIEPSPSLAKEAQELIEQTNNLRAPETQIISTLELEPETPQENLQESTPSTSHTQVKDYEGMDNEKSLKLLEPEVVINYEQKVVNDVSPLSSNESLPLQDQTHEEWNASTEKSDTENELHLVQTGSMNERNNMVPGSDDDTVASEIAEPEVGVNASNYGEPIAAKDKCYNIFYNMCKLPPIQFDKEYFPTNWAFHYCRK